MNSLHGSNYYVNLNLNMLFAVIVGDITVTFHAFHFQCAKRKRYTDREKKVQSHDCVCVCVCGLAERKRAQVQV